MSGWVMLWYGVWAGLFVEFVRVGRKPSAMDDARIADLEGQIERMQATAVDNAAGERLWAARRPDGACARKLGIATLPEPQDGGGHG